MIHGGPQEVQAASDLTEKRGIPELRTEAPSSSDNGIALCVAPGCDWLKLLPRVLAMPRSRSRSRSTGRRKERSPSPDDGEPMAWIQIGDLPPKSNWSCMRRLVTQAGGKILGGKVYPSHRPPCALARIGTEKEADSVAQKLNGMPDSRFPPAWPSPLARRHAMASNRAAQSSWDDSASMSGSVSSWTDVGQAPVAKARPPAPPAEGIQEAPEEQSDPDEVPQDIGAMFGSQAAAQSQPYTPQCSVGSAPATQAAKRVLDSKTDQSNKLAKQKARAKQKGHRSVRWGPMAVGAQNPQNFQLPPFVQQLGSGPEERSVLIVDNRDQRIQSPFQGWLLDEILLNAQSGINILSDRQLVRSPNQGYHMNLFYMKALDGYKLIVAGSMTSYGSVPCAHWDDETANVMTHAAFQPFRWPMMREDSSTWVDFKLKIEGQLLMHLELRGFRSDHDMTVQLNYINDALVMNLREELFVPACVVTVFSGWRVVATSFEVGGRLYVCSDKGTVVALDFPLCHFEIRMTAISSLDSVGMDADRLEFRFRAAGDKLDVACSQITVPATWLVVSRVSGPTLIENAKWCRSRAARIEGPDQTMQMSQLAGIHAHWTAATEAQSLEEVGPRIGAIGVGSHDSNFHLTCESPLLKAQKVVVPKESIALQFHDPKLEQLAIVVPPITGGPSTIPASSATGNLKALAGPANAPIEAAFPTEANVSVTEAGQAPSASAAGDKTILVQRRSLETRLNESMAEAAVTPQAFVSQVQAVRSGMSFLGPEGSTQSVPRSFGPEPVIEVVDEAKDVTDC
eukprot:s1365_g5.t1